VEIEDAAGVGAILNGYDPVAFKKSNNNWYVWNSAFSEGADVADKIVDPVDFSKRKFWKKWDLETNRQYLEVTQQIGLSNVVNISFMVGGGSSETINFNLGPIWLEKDNF
jgi:hypothetical protein